MSTPGRHVRDPQRDLPWRQRPRAPLNMRDGGTSRTVLFAAGMIFALVVGGLNALVGPNRASVWLGVAMLVTGLALAFLAAAYVNRPPYR